MDKLILNIIEFSRYWFALLFGASIAVSFAGMERTRKNYLVFGCFTVALFAFELTSLQLWGMDITLRLYPLLSHLPVVLFIIVYLKRPLLIALTSMVVSYMCCQPPRWIGSVAGAIFRSASFNHIGYIATVFL